MAMHLFPTVPGRLFWVLWQCRLCCMPSWKVFNNIVCLAQRLSITGLQSMRCWPISIWYAVSLRRLSCWMVQRPKITSWMCKCGMCDLFASGFYWVLVGFCRCFVVLALTLCLMCPAHLCTHFLPSPLFQEILPSWFLQQSKHRTDIHRRLPRLRHRYFSKCHGFHELHKLCRWYVYRYHWADPK